MSAAWQVPQLTSNTVLQQLLSVGHVFLPRSSAGGASGSVGRWIGRAGPSCPHGGGWSCRPSPAACTSRPTRRRCGLEAGRGRLRRDATRHAGGESSYAPALATSHHADLARLESGAVSPTSAGTAVCPPSSARDTCHTPGHVGWYGGGHHGCGPAERPRTRVQHVAAARSMLAQFTPSAPVHSRHAGSPRHPLAEPHQQALLWSISLSRIRENDNGPPTSASLPLSFLLSISL